jgi:hypothetical protein
LAIVIKKYLFGVLLLSLSAVVGVVVSCSPTGRSTASQRGVKPIFDTTDVAIPQGPDLEAATPQADTVVSDAPVEAIAAIDSLLGATDLRADSLVRDSLAAILDSIAPATLDSTLVDSLSIPISDSTLMARADTTSRGARPFLDAPVTGKAQDSLVYDVRRRLIFHYNDGDLTYEDNNLKADYIIVDAATKEIYGTGVADTAGIVSRPEFIQGGANYTMDTLRYNLDSKKALVQGFATKDGEGFMTGRRMKKMPDNSINIEGAQYTTCDRVDHPHFYIAMTKAKTIPGKKIITGPAYFVMEDVPLPLGIPGGFFPISTGPTAGLLMPTYGEESNRGFYLRNGGYYFTLGDHADLRLTADLYTLGSWGANAASNYVWRYKFNGGFTASYNNLVVGDKSSPNYSKSNTFSVTWRHTQDPKSNPNQNFSANVNFSTSGQKQMATTSLADHLNTSTSSSIQYSRRWQVGQSTVNLTTQFNLQANSRDTSVNITLPNLSLSVSSFAPFKRKVAAGKQRWYEKVTMSYNMQAQNTTGSVHENDLFTKKTLQQMTNGVTHSIPVQTSFNLLNYINFSPSFNYRESWSFKRQTRIWDPNGGTNGTGEALNTTNPDDPSYIRPESGFFRSYNWNVAGSFSTKIYGQFEVLRAPGKTGWLQAFRHVLTPTVSFSYAPDFQHPRYGMWDYVQTSSSGAYTGYNPNMGYGVISPSGPQASINFSLANQLELKVKDRRDTTEMKKVKIIEQLSVSSSYNFLADSMNLANFPISLRTGEIFPGFAIQLSGTWTPYRYVQVGNGMRPIRKFAIGGGKFGRITQTSWSFGKTFNSPNSAAPDPTSMQGQYVDPYYYDPYNFSNGLDPALRRQYMAAGWYDFNIPWSFTFNYNVSYSNSSTLRPDIRQTLSFNGSVTPTANWGINFNSGYDFTKRKLSHMQINLSRQLHCWEMTFSWVPMGRVKQYSFHIGVKSGMLADIKYDKQSNMYDQLVR